MPKYLFAAVAAIFTGGCFNPLPKPTAVSNQPLGGQCTSDSDCLSGLSCRNFLAENYPSPGFNTTGEASSLCTASCASAPCPSGSVCMTSTGVMSDGGTGALC